MNPRLVQSLFDSSMKHLGWWDSATQLWHAAFVILEKSADAQPTVKRLFRRPGGALSPEENARFEEFNLHKVGLFLVALAIENLLKGLWAGRNQGRIENVKNLGTDLGELKQHKLGDLADLAGMTLSSDEKTLLTDLTKVIVWYGRYPAPLKVEEYGDMMTNGVPIGRFYKGDIGTIQLPLPPEIEGFVDRLVKEWGLLKP